MTTAPQLSIFVLLAAVATACGGSEPATHLQRCYQPDHGYAICYETLSHRRPASDVLMGSPGVSLRIYGRAQGQDIPITLTRGGPAYPENWLVQPGISDCYESRVNYPAVIAMAAADPVDRRLEPHRQIVLDELRARQARPLRIEPPGRCDGITRANMVDEIRRLGAGAGVSPQAAARQRQLALQHAPGAPGLRPSSWQTLLSGCVSDVGTYPICYEVVRHEGAAETPGIVARLASGEAAEVTLLVSAGARVLPPWWDLAHDSYAEHLEAVDVEKLAAALRAREVAAEQRPWLYVVEALVARLRVSLVTSANPSAHDMIEMADAAEVGYEDGSVPPEAATPSPVPADVGHDGHWLHASGASGASISRLEDVRNRGVRPKHGESGWLYRSRLQVFAASLGPLGVHTGTITEVEKSRDGLVWLPEFTDQTCNHGACPRQDPAMQLRYTCDPEVLTYGWYAFDGECSGRWGPWFRGHLCNDDTALQINNAFGRWTGAYCADRHRKHTPQCKVHW